MEESLLMHAKILTESVLSNAAKYYLFCLHQLGWVGGSEGGLVRLRKVIFLSEFNSVCD